jgi:hypothetical protein
VKGSFTSAGATVVVSVVAEAVLSFSSLLQLANTKARHVVTSNCFIIKSFGLFKKFGGYVRLPHGMNDCKSVKGRRFDTIKDYYFL